MASGFWGVNSFFLALEVLLMLGVIFTGRKDGNGWIIVYMSQLNPLVRPQLQNT